MQIFNRENKADVYFGTVSKHTKRFEIGTLQPPNIIVRSPIVNIGVSAKHVRRFTISAEETNLEISNTTVVVGIAHKRILKTKIESSEVKYGNI